MAEPVPAVQRREYLARLKDAAWQRPLIGLCAVLALISCLFVAVPSLDLAVSGLFHDAVAGFGGRYRTALEFVRVAGRWMETAVLVVAIGSLAAKMALPATRLLMAPRASLFLVATFVVGPGLIVNGVLKEYWGRARPREIVEFGGDALFTPAWQMSDACASNCSFVSGEAASAMWLIALVFVVPLAWRTATASVALAFAAAVSLNRIAVGGHFLSDVLIAWLLTLIVIVLLHRHILIGLPQHFDSAVEDRLGRAGRALQAFFGTRTRLPFG
jgi:lipid A 4'-phosphatase